MDSTSFALKNQLLTKFDSGNFILDIFIGTIACTIITSIISYLNLRDFKNKINELKCCKSKRKCSIFMEYNKKILSTSFKGVLHYIDSNNITDIQHIREDKDWKYCYNREKDVESIYYLPESDNEYNINNDIKVLFGTREKKMGEGKQEVYKELISMELFSKTLNIDDLRKFVKKCKEDFLQYMNYTLLNKQTLFNCNYNEQDKNLHISTLNFESNRKFDNLFFDQKKILLDKVNYFLNNKDWYAKRGIPYTLGILLYGEPGCGKTSFIKALLNYLDYKKKKRVHGIYINLTNKFDFDELEELILGDTLGDYNIPRDQRLYIFEDIDCMGDIVKDRDIKKNEKIEINKKLTKMLKNKNTDVKNKDDDIDYSSIMAHSNESENKNNNSLSKLLNILDGIIETPGRIIIMTTNKIETLDKALIRPGRIDIQINFTKCSKIMFKDIIENFYEKKVEVNLLNKYKDFELTPAELIQKCFEHQNMNNILD